MPEDHVDGAMRNHLLAALSQGDRALLDPHIVLIDLPLRKQLEGRNKRIDHVYFIESGIASVVANGIGDKSLEVGIVGREGMTGVAVVMATSQSPHETYMQSAGSAWRIGAKNLRDLLAESATLHELLLKYGYGFLIQATYTAYVNGRCKMEDRLARWLLMAHDRADGDDLSLTHEFLAVTLGVRRPGITAAMHAFQDRGLVRTKRGVISILNCAKLEDASHGAYGEPELELRRLFREFDARLSKD